MTASATKPFSAFVYVSIIFVFVFEEEGATFHPTTLWGPHRPASRASLSAAWLGVGVE